jgi:uridine phosphorylase
METATVFALAQARGVRAGSVLVVSDTVVPARVRIGPDALQSAEERMGRVALAALVERS